MQNIKGKSVLIFPIQFLIVIQILDLVYYIYPTSCSSGRQLYHTNSNPQYSLSQIIKKETGIRSIIIDLHEIFWEFYSQKNSILNCVGSNVLSHRFLTPHSLAWLSASLVNCKFELSELSHLSSPPVFPKIWQAQLFSSSVIHLRPNYPLTRRPIFLKIAQITIKLDKTCMLELTF